MLEGKVEALQLKPFLTENRPYSRCCNHLHDVEERQGRERSAVFCPGYVRASQAMETRKRRQQTEENDSDQGSALATPGTKSVKPFLARVNSLPT